MSNPTPVVDFADDLAAFLARTNQFGESNQDLIQQKFNKQQNDGSVNPIFAALESRSRSLAQWANLVDDFMLQYFTQGQNNPATGGWSVVYDRDLRTVPTTDMNSAGSTIVIDGVTWETPSAARNGDNMVVAANSFGFENTVGLRSDGPGNSRINPGTVTATSIFTSLRSLSNNTATPFDADPTRDYLIQCYVSSEDADADHEWAGVFIFREGSGIGMSEGLPGDGALYRAGFGFISSNGPRALEGTGGTGASPARFTYRPEGLTVPLPVANCPSIWWNGPQSQQFGGGPYNTGGDAFPTQDELQFFSTARDSTDVENDIVMHPDYGFFIGMAICAENLSNNYDATIQRFRVLQR